MRTKIWASSKGVPHPVGDCHWQRQARWDECERRGKPGIYWRAWEDAVSLGASPPPPRVVFEAGSGKAPPVQVAESAAGFYLGTVNEAGPYSRESQEYWRSRKEAEKALETGSWTARRNVNPPPAEFAGSLERPSSRSR